MVAFLLGYTGYRETMPEGLSPLDVVYKVLQLYALDSQPETGEPWQLQAARFLAPLSLATAAAVAAALFFRDQLQRLLIALFARDHVVVVGLSSSSGAIAEAIAKQGKRVVVIEANDQHARLRGLQASGAYTVVGDGRHPVILRRARVDRADHVVITTGDDTTNLDIADQVRAVRGDDARQRTTVHVAIEDPRLWLELGRLAFGRISRGTSVECFNAVDRTARRLVASAAATGRLERVALIGSGPVTDRVTAHVMRRARALGHSVNIESVPDDEIGVVIVCHAHHALSEAIALARAFPKAHVAVAMDTESADVFLGLLDDLGGRLHIVPATSESLAEGLLRDSAIEVMARAKHEDYMEHERLKGLAETDNKSLLPWDELPESLRESNRRFAASVAETLGRIGATLQPLRGAPESDLQLAADDLEQLAINEHDRWEADLRRDGWTFADTPKDPIAKTHPLLVPWDDLSEAEREKDRDAIRAIPDMLGRVGYELRLNGTT